MTKSKVYGKKQAEEIMSFNTYVALVGFFGGLIWSIVGYIAFYLNFVNVGPALALMPWALADWKNGWVGQLVGIGFISVVSIAAAFLYRIFLAKFYYPWPGMIFGIAIWLGVFWLFNPMFPGLKSFLQLDINTLITTGCLYLIWGLFIGYSVSFEYNERLTEKTESIQSE